MIAITDYGMGNLRSVSKAFEHIGAGVSITSSAKEILKADALVVPGVGAFGDCITNLKHAGLIDTIKEFIKTGKPYLGLCLGMQILFDKSEEAQNISGLGILAGSVKKFPASLGLKIPHMGWNQIRNTEYGIQNTILKNIPNNSYVYFVHSYYVDPDDKSVIATETEYGIKFCSMIHKNNIWATQFHPEKSQKIGLQILKDFVKLCTPPLF